MTNYLKPVAAILIPNLGGFVGSMVIRPEVRPKSPGEKSWFMALKQPALKPPSWLIGPIWTGLNCSMGYASYMIWRDGGGFDGDAKLPLACYGASLALNWAWSPLFFKYKKLGLMTNYLKPVAAILIPNLGGFAGAMVTRPEVRPKSPGEVTWFMALKKPALRPPNWLFAPVWTGLYCSMGYASYMIWRDGGGFDGDAKLPLACYGASLALNWAWSPLFFKYKKLGLAFFENVCLWGSILASIVTFNEVNTTASRLLYPYLGWVTFACYLNFYIWRNNKDRTD